MHYEILDRLLAMHFSKTPTNDRLNQLEQDVWRKIHIANADNSQPWYEKMMQAFSVPEFRLASLAIAFVIGITASSIFAPSSTSFSPVKISSADALGLNIFTTQSPYLHSNLIERI